MTDYPNNIPAKLEIIKASEITPKEVRWLWYPYIPFGKVTLLQGDPGDGKSKLMLSLAALLSKGAPLPFADEDESGEPMTVIYQTTEDDADDTVVPRFNSAGGDGDRLIFIKEDEKSLTFGDDRIREAVEKYNAKLLILDEPTSGLDPVSRDELLKILSEYIEDGEHSVLFSTHITGDLERAADYITYISYGELYFTGSKDDFVDMFRIVKGGIEELSDDLKNKAAGIRTFPTGFEALMKTEDINGFSNLTIEPATIDEIVVFTSKKGDDYE